MDSIAVGKLLPNLKVTVGNDESIDVKSDDKISDDESSVNSDDDDQKREIVRSWMQSLQSPKIYRNKGGAFTTGLDLVSEGNSEKLDKRAERFGIELEDSLLTPENISSLYKSMGIDIENKSSAKEKNIRLDALHLRGINELNTNEVFKYFQDYGPASVEWINDSSCNVVWMDESTCARALLRMSKPLKTSKSKEGPKTSDSEEPMDMLLDGNTAMKSEIIDDKILTEAEAVIKDKDIPSADENLKLDIPVPPGCWRLGIPHSKAKNILLRFATKDDKKVKGAEKRSEFYKKYGNPNYGGLRGLISGSRKRKMLAITNRQVIEGESSKPSEESSHTDDVPAPKPRLPRMRMYADDEEQKARISRYTETEKQSVHSRLGRKYTKEDLCHIGIFNIDFDRSSSPEIDGEYESTDFRDRFSKQSERYQSIDRSSSQTDMYQSRNFRDRPSLQSDRFRSRNLRDRSLQSDGFRSRDLRQRFSLQSDGFRSRDLRERSLQSDGFRSRNLRDRSSFQSDGFRSRDLRDRSPLQSDGFKSRDFKSSEKWIRPNRRDTSPHEQLDLRKKIKKLKTDSDVTKHRSPLCMDD